ncbi:hypothetical protein KP79_PYT24471 [Mizuhopecten yessoensis]|uniref:Uncharacterized protein n=1 Tax=Mizuhopecten yessoensis TaxID=6573 RepID=A0A210QKF9_MIZYE|nr:hypothetical protein KP79_PYT24471 [Mizuhopecten yessoensis]
MFVYIWQLQCLLHCILGKSACITVVDGSPVADQQLSNASSHPVSMSELAPTSVFHNYGI